MQKESLSIITVKTLLAVVIFTGIGTIIIGGGYLMGDYYKGGGDNKIVKPVIQELLVTTDKIEYEQGENIRIAVRNNFDKDIYYYENIYCYLEYQKENGTWVQSWIINMPCLKGEVKRLDSFKSINRTLYFTGNNHIYYSGGGKYRVAFSYGYSNKNIEEKIIYSNEFIIKEKVKDETADWKTYRNEEYGFEVKYPKDAVIKSEEINKIKIGISTLNAEIREEYFLIDIKKNINNSCSNPLSTIIQKTETVVLNDIEFVKETGAEGAAGSFYNSINYSTLKNNSCFSLSFVIAAKFTDINISQEEETFDQILSTFKFIEK